MLVIINENNDKQWEIIFFILIFFFFFYFLSFNIDIHNISHICIHQSFYFIIPFLLINK
ncbi:hypothetical protein H8356DRAFT_546414 [Neocallimastix lanati (nom. inval.)]|nr:hypothetical protein H8356DRAFT_546414 [Neocallimastix sp. JGI-2020a]